MDWRYNTLWHDQLPAGAYKHVDLKPGQVKVDGAVGVQYVVIGGFKPKSHALADLVGVEEAIYLELIHSNIRSLEGIGKCGPIKRLEAHHCVKLEDGAALLDLRESLEWLHIDMSKKFSFPDIHHLKNLKVLCLNSCGALENLKFLYELPSLLDFRFVDTNVVDGDLTPLLDHPSLVSAGFLNKRHYNLSEREVKAHLAGREEEACSYVYKGQWETFTYWALGEPDGRVA